MAVINQTGGAKLRVGALEVRKAYRGAAQVYTLNTGAGGLLSVAIGADGWYADLTFQGQQVGGTYSLTPDGTPKLSLTVTSLGFDDAGNATTVTRTVVGTRQVRKPFPNFAQNEESVFGTADVTVRVALSDYVYAKDKSGAGNSGTDVTVTVAPGLYTVGGVASLGGGLTATNNSTWAYPKVIGNWSWPGNDKVGATITPRATVFQAHAQQGRPVRAVKFTATGVTSGAAVAQTVTAMTVDATVAGVTGAPAVPEYVGSLSTTTLTQGEKVTLRFQAFPWIGDAASVLDTTGGAAAPSPLVGPISVICDKAGTYNTSFAVVDPVNGNNATAVLGLGTLNTGSPPAAYTTLVAAYDALRNYANANLGRNNPGGAVIYMRTGDHAWIGGTYSAAGTVADAWLTATAYPGDARSGVVIATASGSQNLGFLQKLVGVKITASNASGLIAFGNSTWLDQCEVNTPGTNPTVHQQPAWYVTRCLVTAWGQGIRPFSTVNSPAALVRGNDLGGLDGNGVLVYTCLGNVRASTAPMAGSLFFDAIAGSAAPATANAVLAYNRAVYAEVGSPAIGMRGGAVSGLAVVQNLLEQIASTTSPLVQIAADATTASPVDNVLLWHNVFVGQRVNLGYNEVSTNTTTPSDLAFRRGWSAKSNIMDDGNIKSDTFAGSGYVASGVRIGNWPFLWGVACSSNVNVEAGYTGAGGTFLWEFLGLKSDQPADAAPNASGVVSGTGRAVTYPAFVSRASWTGGAAGAGNGDYHLAAGSPAKGIARDWLLPVDLAGVARTAATDAGVYAP